MESSSNRRPILQSGFISLTEKGLAVPVNPSDPLSQVILFKGYREPSNLHFYSKTVTSLYHRWGADSKSIKDFNFREAILKSAFEAFATPSMYKWIVAQNDSPYFSNMHKLFILNTLDYLVNDKPRDFNVTQWASLLESTSKSCKVVINVDNYFDKESTSRNSDAQLPSSMDDIIRIWTSKVNGFEDLLITLYSIFGDRVQKSDVVEGSDVSAV